MKLLKLVAPTLIAAGVMVSAPAMADATLAQAKGCMACHKVDAKLVGPAYQDVAKKYAGNKDALKMLTAKVKAGGKGVWGEVPMPPNSAVSDADIEKLVKWVLAGAK